MDRLTLDQILRAAEDLSPDDRAVLIQQLQALPRLQVGSAAARIARFKAAQIHAQINQEPSVRREDWYGDDGR